jgi:serine acetyltransferase
MEVVTVGLGAEVGAGAEVGGEVDVGATWWIGSGPSPLQPVSSAAAATVTATEHLTPRTYPRKLLPRFGNIEPTE